MRESREGGLIFHRSAVSQIRTKGVKNYILLFDSGINLSEAKLQKVETAHHYKENGNFIKFLANENLIKFGRFW